MVDLHTHTTASDGSLTPTQLVEAAAKIGLSHLAVTDHDTVGGVEEAAQACRVHGITFIPGIELSTVYDGKSIDMLGYGVDPSHPSLAVVLKKASEERNERVGKMVGQLQSAGYPIEQHAVDRLAAGGVPGRPHVALALVESGVVGSVKQAFDELVGRGKVGFVPKKNLPSKQAIALIKEAGGVAVVAHPMFLKMDETSLERMLIEFKRVGLAGLEVYYSRHGKDDVDCYRRIANNLNLVMTGGSDFHGDSKPDIKLGMGPQGSHLKQSIAANLLAAIKTVKSARS